MAEGLLRHISGDRFESLSAGLEPDNQVHHFAILVMQEIGIDISSQKPKAVDIYLGKTMIHDLMILCDKTQSTCPNVWPGTPFKNVIIGQSTIRRLFQVQQKRNWMLFERCVMN